MKIRQELDNDNPKNKIGYYDLGRIHKELNPIKKGKITEKKEEKINIYEGSFYTSSLDRYDRNSNLGGFCTEWFQLETKFVNIWLISRLTTINKQSNCDTLRNSVMMQYPNQKMNFAQRIITAKPKFWMKFSIEILEVKRRIFRLDFREVVSIYCAINSIFYHKSSNTIYEVCKRNKNEISFIKLSKSFIDTNKMRDKISELKRKLDVQYTFHHGSHKYKTVNDLTTNYIIAKTN